MKYLRLAARVLLAGSHVLLAVILSFVLLPAKPESGVSRFQQNVMSWLMRRCLKLLCVRVEVRGEVCSDRDAGARLIVSNHISWLDILLIGSVYPACFLSKAEVRRWFVFGHLAQRFGTIFLHRGSGATSALDEIGARLSRGVAVAVFPEGTTTDGSAVRPFYPRMLAAAINAGVLVQPAVLRYPVAGGGVSTLVPFTRNQPLLWHLLPLLQEKSITAVVSFTQPIDPRGSDRRRLAERARDAIVAELENISAAT